MNDLCIRPYFSSKLRSVTNGLTTQHLKPNKTGYDFESQELRLDRPMLRFALSPCATGSGSLLHQLKIPFELLRAGIRCATTTACRKEFAACPSALPAL